MATRFALKQGNHAYLRSLSKSKKLLPSAYSSHHSQSILLNSIPSFSNVTILNGSLRYNSTEVTKDGEITKQEDDECPVWQNPLHHNNPDKAKIMIEDFEPGETPEFVPLPPFDDGSGRVLAPPHIHDIADEIVSMSMLEVKELVERVADHFGIEDQNEDEFNAIGAENGGTVEDEVQEEKTSFDLKLIGFGAKSKIKVIKEIRAMTSLGLKDAKDLVESAPATVKKDIKKEEAEELKAKLEALGATIEIS